MTEEEDGLSKDEDGEKRRDDMEGQGESYDEDPVVRKENKRAEALAWRKLVRTVLSKPRAEPKSLSQFQRMQVTHPDVVEWHKCRGWYKDRKKELRRRKKAARAAAHQQDREECSPAAASSSAVGVAAGHDRTQTGGRLASSGVRRSTNN